MSTIKLTPSQIQTKTEELSGSETEFEEDSDATTLDSLYPIINESQTTIIVPDQQQQSQATQKIETNKRRRASDLPQKYAERKMSTQKQINKSLTPKPRGRRATSSNSSFQKQDKPQKEEEKLLFKDFTFVFIPTTPSKSQAFKATRFSEYGATILSSPNKITSELYKSKNLYILVDGRFGSSKVKEILKLDGNISYNSLNIVKDAWASDCISNNRILDFQNNEVGYRVIETKGDLSFIGVGGSSVDNGSTIISSQTQSDKKDNSQDIKPNIKKEEELEEDFISLDPSDPEYEYQKEHKSKIKRTPWNTKLLNLTKPKPITELPITNEYTISVLEDLMKYHENSGDRDRFRVVAYRKAIGVLRKTQEPILTASQAIQIPGIGSSIALKIEEIVKTKRLQKLDVVKDDQKVKSLEAFKKIYGVANKTAEIWYDSGFKTIEDIQQKAKLNEAQVMGLFYYDDWNKRIPRVEAEKHILIVKDIARMLDENIVIYPMGSYRRKKNSLGDIDFLITGLGYTDLEVLQIFLNKLLEALFDKNYLVCSLTKFFDNGYKWYGGAKIKKETIKTNDGNFIEIGGICRRVDFLLVPYHQLGGAFLYFTGDDIFNRMTRERAKQMKYSLNQYGLFRNPNHVSIDGERIRELENGRRGWRERSDPKRIAIQKLCGLELAEGQCEKRIFQILGIPYVEPKDRTNK